MAAAAALYCADCQCKITVLSHTTRRSGYWYPQSTLSELQPQPLPAFDEHAFERFPYGACSAAAKYVGDLLSAAVPDLDPATGTLGIVAVARRPGVLTKVAVRARAALPSSTAIGIGADHLARVREQLDGERIHVVVWQRSASAYIADALGLGEVPPMVLLAGIGHARVRLARSTCAVSPGGGA